MKCLFSLIKQDALFLYYTLDTVLPDICPYDLKNAYVKDIMDEEQLDLNLIFITLDPLETHRKT